jgi:hypothetical protein
MMCKADISEANNSIHKMMIILSSLSPPKNAMINSDYIIRQTAMRFAACSVNFWKILYKPMKIALSTGGIGRAFSTYLSLFTSLRYNPGGRGFYSQCGNCDFLFTGSTQPVT